mmetsp:Transcript_87596/g.247180  ORF Transcript_87596/g.247180 Transcript_87596/m.247180 type:complete len:312 (+) Transcript_87596:98-1033(+)
MVLPKPRRAIAHVLGAAAAVNFVVRWSASRPCSLEAFAGAPRSTDRLLGAASALAAPAHPEPGSRSLGGILRLRRPPALRAATAAVCRGRGRGVARRAAAVEDESLVRRGIDAAIKKGLLPAAVEVETAVEIALTGRSAREAADEILAALGEAAASGSAVVLYGPQVEGKKAVIQELRPLLPKAEVWTMNTFFRAMTFLLLTMSEQTGGNLEFVLQQPFMLAAGIEMIGEMKGDRGVGDLIVEAEGMMAMSSDGQKIEDNLPLALEYGQGEVLNFVNDALASTTSKGTTVFLDGPEEMLKYVRTPHRFYLS